MGAVRRSHAAALTSLGTLLLLLLARLPTPPPPPPAPRHSDTSTLPSPPPSPLTNKSTQAPLTSAPFKSKPAEPAKPRVKNVTLPVLTGDVYAAGHERPHPELCPSLGAKLQLLILVTSAPSHSSAREAVRMTWGHYAIRSDVAFDFVMGTLPDSMKPSIEAEDMLYRDIIVGRFVDSYSNLTLKTLSMLEWVDTYCPRVQRMLKTDDDMFINVPRLLQFANAPAHVNATKIIWGRLIKKSPPRRSNQCAVQRVIAVHMVKFHEQFDLWRQMVDGKVKCAS